MPTPNRKVTEGYTYLIKQILIPFMLMVGTLNTPLV